MKNDKDTPWLGHKFSFGLVPGGNGDVIRLETLCDQPLSERIAD